MEFVYFETLINKQMNDKAHALKIVLNENILI